MFAAAVCNLWLSTTPSGWLSSWLLRLTPLLWRGGSFPSGRPSTKNLLEEESNVEGGRWMLGEGEAGEDEPLLQFFCSRKTRKSLGMKPKSSVCSDRALFVSNPLKEPMQRMEAFFPAVPR